MPESIQQGREDKYENENQTCIYAHNGATLMMAQQTEAGRKVPSPRPKEPCDIYAAAGDPCVAAYSTTRALYASYSGPLYQVKRQSDGKTLNIGVVQPVASPIPDAGIPIGADVVRTIGERKKLSELLGRPLQDMVSCIHIQNENL